MVKEWGTEPLSEFVKSMWHSNCRTTLDIYTRAVDQQKREANLKVIEIDAAAGIAKTSAPSELSEVVG